MLNREITIVNGAITIQAFWRLITLHIEYINLTQKLQLSLSLPRVRRKLFSEGRAELDLLMRMPEPPRSGGLLESGHIPSQFYSIKRLYN